MRRNDIDKAFAAHVLKLEGLALSCPYEDRRLDACRSLAAMALLVEGWRPPDGGGETENRIVNLSAFRDALCKAA